jgi:hypothetical protein
MLIASSSCHALAPSVRPEALLGVVTLENLGLVFDPFRRALHPMRILMI